MQTLLTSELQNQPIPTYPVDYAEPLLCNQFNINRFLEHYCKAKFSHELRALQ